MGGQIDVRADAAIAGTAGAAVGRELVALIRRLAAGHGGQRPPGLIAGWICVRAGELPHAGVRSGLVPAKAMTRARLDRRLLAGTGMAWAAAGSGPGGRRRRVSAGQPADAGYAGRRCGRGSLRGRCRGGWAGAAQDQEKR